MPRKKKGEHVDEQNPLGDVAAASSVNGKRFKGPRTTEYLLIGDVLNGNGQHVIGKEATKGRAAKAQNQLARLVGVVYSRVHVFKGKPIELA